MEKLQVKVKKSRNQKKNLEKSRKQGIKVKKKERKLENYSSKPTSIQLRVPE